MRRRRKAILFYFILFYFVCLFFFVCLFCLFVCFVCLFVCLLNFIFILFQKKKKKKKKKKKSNANEGQSTLSPRFYVDFLSNYAVNGKVLLKQWRALQRYPEKQQQFSQNGGLLGATSNEDTRLVKRMKSTDTADSTKAGQEQQERSEISNNHQISKGKEQVQMEHNGYMEEDMDDDISSSPRFKEDYDTTDPFIDDSETV